VVVGQLAGETAERARKGAHPHRSTHGMVDMLAPSAASPLQRANEPDEVAEVIAYPAGNTARLLTGVVLAVDAGRTAASDPSSQPDPLFDRHPAGCGLTRSHMILVTGATGNVGSETVRLLADQQQPVRALVRDASRLQRAGVEVVTGDFDDPVSLDAAMDGVDTVVLVSPAIPRQEISVIDAAARAGVTHVIKASSKASADSPVERRRGQAQIEQHLQASGLAWTLLRSNAYLQNLLALAPIVKQSGGFVMSAGDGQVGMVDARDVAAVAATLATNPSGHAGATDRPPEQS